MTDSRGTLVTFLDQTGAKSVRAKISPTVQVRRIIPSIITKMSLPTTAPDGTPMSYSLDHKEGGKRLLETQTLPEADIKEGDHLIVYPEVVAGVKTSADEGWNSPYCTKKHCRKLLKYGDGNQFLDEDGRQHRYCWQHWVERNQEVVVDKNS